MHAHTVKGATIAVPGVTPSVVVNNVPVRGVVLTVAD